MVMWQSHVSRRDLAEGLRYYTTTVGAHPHKYAYVLVGVCAVQVAVLTAEMIMGEETSWLFDGASLVLVLATGLLYYITLLPCTSPTSPVFSSLQEVTPPAEMPVSQFASSLATLRDVAGAHILMCFALTGVVLLQCGKYYSERLQERERNEEVDVRLVRRQRQLQQAERTKQGPALRTAAPSVGGPEAST